MSFHRSSYFYREHDQATLSQLRLSHIKQTKSCGWKMKKISPGIMEIVIGTREEVARPPQKRVMMIHVAASVLIGITFSSVFIIIAQKTVTMTLKGPDRASIFKGRWYGGYFQTHAALFTDECSRALKIRSPMEDKNDSLLLCSLDTTVLQREYFLMATYTRFIVKFPDILSKISLGRI